MLRRGLPMHRCRGDGLYGIRYFIENGTSHLLTGCTLLMVIQTKEAIIRHTFPSKAEHLKASAADLGRLRNWYHQGKAKIQYLHLRYLGFNKPFLNALLDLGLMSQAARAGTTSVKRSSSSGEGSVAKKARS